MTPPNAEIPENENTEGNSSSAGRNTPPKEQIGKYVVDRRLAHPCQWNCLLGKEPGSGKSFRITQVPKDLSNTDLAKLQKKLVSLKRVDEKILPKVIEVIRQGQDNYVVTSLSTGTPLLGIQWASVKSDVVAKIALKLFQAIGWMKASGFSHGSVDPLHVRYDSKLGTVAIDYPESGFLFRPQDAGYRWASSAEQQLWNRYHTTSANLPDLSHLRADAGEAVKVLKYMVLQAGENLPNGMADFLNNSISKIIQEGSETDWKALEAAVLPFCGESQQGSTPSSLKLNTNTKSSSRKKSSKPKEKSSQFRTIVLSVLIPLPVVCIGIAVWYALGLGSSDKNDESGTTALNDAIRSVHNADKEGSAGKTTKSDLDSLSLDSQAGGSADGLQGLEGTQNLSELAASALTEEDSSILGIAKSKAKKDSGNVDQKSPGSSNGLAVNAKENSTDEASEKSGDKTISQAGGAEQEKNNQEWEVSKDQFVTIEDLPESFSLTELNAASEEQGSSSATNLQWKIGELNELSATNLDLDWEILLTKEGEEWSVRPKDADADHFRRWQVIKKTNAEGLQVVAELLAKKNSELILEVKAENKKVAQPIAFSKARFRYQDGLELQHEIRFAAPKVVAALPFGTKGSTKSFSLELSPQQLNLHTIFYLGKSHQLYPVEEGSSEYKELKVKKRESVYCSDPDVQLGSILLRTPSLNGKKFQIRGRLEMISPNGPVRLTKKTFQQFINTAGQQTDVLKRQLAQVKSKRAKPGQGDQKKRLINDLEGKIQIGEKLLERLADQSELVENLFRDGLGFRVKLKGLSGSVTLVETANLQTTQPEQ